MKNITINKIIFVSVLKYIMHSFKKCNKIMNIDVNYDNLLLDHPIYTIFGGYLQVLIIVDKNLLQRDLCNDEYFTLIEYKINANIENICVKDLEIIKNFLLTNYYESTDEDNRILNILNKLIIWGRHSDEYGRHHILDIINSKYYSSKIIAYADVNTDIIVNIIKFATTMCSYNAIEIYDRFIDINNIDIEKYFNYENYGELNYHFLINCVTIITMKLH
jgi:hypothetical protein